MGEIGDIRKTIEYQLGQVAGQLVALNTAVEHFGDGMSDMSEAVKALTAEVASLPCAERLESCRREREAILRLLQSDSDDRRSTSRRKWGFLGAMIGAAVAAGAELIARFVWH